MALSLLPKAESKQNRIMRDGKRAAGSDSSDNARISGGKLSNPKRLRSVVITPSDSAARELSSLLATLDSTLHRSNQNGVWTAITTLLCYATCLLAPYQVCRLALFASTVVETGIYFEANAHVYVHVILGHGDCARGGKVS